MVLSLIVLLLAGCSPVVVAGQAPGNVVGVASPTPAALLGRYTTAQPEATGWTPPDPTATITPAQELSEPQPGEPRSLTQITPTPVTPLPATPTVSPLEGFQICSPLVDILLEDLPRLISDGYHPPLSARSDERHPGIDIAFYNWKGHRQIAGVPVQSVLPGRVAVAEKDTFPFGNVVVVETQSQQLPADLKERLGIAEDRSLYLLYAHMQDDSLRVMLGQQVTPCQTLGQVGRTGNSGAAHLHLENRIGPPSVSFVGFAAYTKEATQQEKDNYRRWATGGEFVHFDPLRLLLYEFGYEPTPVVQGRWSD